MTFFLLMYFFHTDKYFCTSSYFQFSWNHIDSDHAITLLQTTRKSWSISIVHIVNFGGLIWFFLNFSAYYDKWYVAYLCSWNTIVTSCSQFSVVSLLLIKFRWLHSETYFDAESKGKGRDIQPKGCYRVKSYSPLQEYSQMSMVKSS